MEKRVKQLNINAEEMDRRASVARRLNRNEDNRLRKQYEQFRDNHDVVSVEIEHEIKRIQHDLDGIREISGYEDYARTLEGDDSAPGNMGKRKRKGKSHRFNRQTNTRTNDVAKLRRRITRDEGATNGEARFRGKGRELNGGGGEGIPRMLATAPANAKAAPQLGGTRRISRSGLGKKDGKLPQLMTNACDDTHSALEVDSVSEAREQAKKRLLGGAGQGEPEKQHGDSDAMKDDDVEPYMYVPPDGRKRTVYLIPPLGDLLKEARKARYLRIPKRLLPDDQEDLESELSIDEIFSKKT